MEHYFTNKTDLKSELRTIENTYKGISFSFLSDNGVFSKDEIDYGSFLLVDSIVKNGNNYKSILDVGCGYGYIGITLAKMIDAEVLMVDVNRRALHLAENNIKTNEVRGKTLESSVYDSVEGKFDLVVSNPPIRAGKEIVLGILNGAINHLNPDGELWFVIRKNQGVKSAVKQISNLYNCEEIVKSKGFYVIKAKKR